MTGLPLAAVELYLKGRGAAEKYPGTVWDRGLADETLLKRGKGRMVVLTRGTGPGLILEQHFDATMITVRAVGLQRDHDDAERFADDLDGWMLAPGNVDVGGHRALYVVRAGGGPTHIQTDRSRRAHFQCSYVIPVASGL